MPSTKTLPRLARWLPDSLAGRFAIAAAGLATAALVLISLGSWWLVSEQQQRALQELSAHERQFRAAGVGSDLEALNARVAEMATSTILATGLVDSAGRETYLVPFLRGIQQINGIPVQILFADFEGKEIASNGSVPFAPEHRRWLRDKLTEGVPAAAIFRSVQGDELVGMAPLVYARTDSPEGAVLYKIDLSQMNIGPGLELRWGPETPNATPVADRGTPVPVPGVFEPLQFRVVGEVDPGIYGSTGLGLPYLPLIVTMLVLFSVIVLAGLRLARLLTLDLRRLAQFSASLRASGTRSERASETGSSEVSDLARSLNQMLDRLDAQHDALQTEQRKLQELTAALRDADRKKDDFLAMLGHELRNPLAPIRASAEVLRRLPGTDARIVRTSEIIARQVGHMTRIVGDLLDVARVTRGLVTLEKVELDVADVVATAVEQVRPAIESHGHRLTLTTAPGRLVVLADRARMVQVLSNLLANAAKYTPPGGHITLAVEATPDDVVWKVQDSGVGIPAELLPEVFNLFTQGSRDSDRSQGGLGLGLALVKHLVEGHGGTVAVDSAGAGRGATFTVRLPRHASARAAPFAGSDAGPGRAERRRILVVDDNVDAAEALEQLLTLAGHSVCVAHDGPSALARVQAAGEAFDTFILDIGLPGMDGTELARRLGTLPQVRSARLIALTGYGLATDRQRSADAGFDHHLVKPVDLAALESVLGRPH